MLTNYKTDILFYDANNQKIAEPRGSTNEYGSFNGSFQLPEGMLNGQFYITGFSK